MSDATLKARLGELFEGRAMLSIDGTPRMLQVGETSPEGVRLVAASATQAQRLKMARAKPPAATMPT